MSEVSGMPNLLIDSFFEGINLDGSALFLLYLFLFLMADVIGYLIEVLFRRIFTAKKWVNPGFMKGPWLPLYGFGCCIMFTYCWLMLVYFPLPEGAHFYNPTGSLFNSTTKWGPNVYDLIPISIMGFSLIILELVAGLIFVKGFKVKLWDYSNMKWNIAGVICPVFDVIWFVVAIIYYYLINPYIFKITTDVYNSIVDSSGYVKVLPIFFFGVIFGLMLYDFVSSLGLFAKVRTYVKSSGLAVNYTKFVYEQKEKLSYSKKKFIEYLPKVIQEEIEKEKNKDGSGKKVKNILRNAFLINPDQEYSYKDAYGDDNRPKKDEN